MLFLLDTNAVRDAMNGHPPVTTRLASLAPSDSVAIPTTVRGEVLFGIERLPQGKRRDDIERRAMKIMSVTPTWPIPIDAADRYSHVKQACRLAGVALDENDLWIAATVLALGATLVTRDEDFGRVKGLVVADWSK